MELRKKVSNVNYIFGSEIGQIIVKCRGGGGVTGD